MALTELGTTFIKFGQVLSTRTGLVGPDLAGELSMLQDNTPADPPEVARATIETELGKPPEEVFAEFALQAREKLDLNLRQGSRERINYPHATNTKP